GYGVRKYNYLYSLSQTSDGGYIAGGESKAEGYPPDIFILKLDSSGNIQWAKTYGGKDWDEPYSISQTSDGGYIAGGYTWSFGAGYGDFLIIKLDSSGNIQWAKTYGGSGNDYLYSISQTSDGGYIVGGETDSFGAGRYDFLIIKLDSSGNIYPNPGSGFYVTTPSLSVTTPSLVTTNANITLHSVSLSINTPSLTITTPSLKVYELASRCTAGPTVPDPPRNLTATPGDQKVTLNWQAPINDGGSAILYYKIYRGGSFVASTTNLTYTDTGLTNETKYCYYVTAVNSIGESSQSNTACATPRGNLPNPPTNLTATPGLNKISLSWTAPSQPPTVSGYYIYRSNDNRNYSKITTTTNTTYDDLNLASGKTYYYYVTAYNSAGESGKSNVASATPYGVPTPPQSLSLSVGNKVMNLSWKAPVSDGGSPITEYRIYRSKQTTPWSLLATTNPSTLSYSDTNIVLGETYYYVVTAKNSYGESNYSNIVSGKAGTIPSCPRNLELKSYSDHLKISWDKPSSDGYYSIDKYIVYRKVGATGTYSKVKETTSYYYNDYDVSSGITYYYYVTAVNEIGESTGCSEVSGSIEEKTPGLIYQARSVCEDPPRCSQTYDALYAVFNKPTYISKVYLKFYREYTYPWKGGLYLYCDISPIRIFTHDITSYADYIDVKSPCNYLLVFTYSGNFPTAKWYSWSSFPSPLTLYYYDWDLLYPQFRPLYQIYSFTPYY
ncbi:MAG: fibronectin type III domain-containing protein, partial [Minisyncoccia bacterium]